MFEFKMHQKEKHKQYDLFREIMSHICPLQLKKKNSNILE